MSDLAVGDRVVEVNRHHPRTGVVTATGGCGWALCQYGDECVTVWFDGGFTSENRRPDMLDRLADT